MQYYTRMTNCIPRDRYPSAELVETDSGTQEKTLGFLYGTALGRALLKPLVSPFVSKTCGRFLDSRLSRKLIPYFIKKCDLDMTFVNREVDDFKSYNDFFTRELVANARPVDHTNDHLISPCDSKLLVYEINEDLCMNCCGMHVSLKNTKAVRCSFSVCPWMITTDIAISTAEGRHITAGSPGFSIRCIRRQGISIPSINRIPASIA